MPIVQRTVRLAVSAALLTAACSAPDATGPAPGPSFTGTSTGGDGAKVVVCKDATAPTGTYDFTVSQAGAAGTLPAGPAFSLSPGQCVDAWQALSADFTTVTVAEVDIPGGVQFDSAMVVLAGGSPQAVSVPTVSVTVNFYHGATITYFNSETFDRTLGRMTGGGGQITIGDVRVTRGLTLHCDITLSNNLEINWPDNKWHLTKPITEADCVDDPNVSPEPPVAPFDTFIGEGVGELNGADGSIVRFIFVDSGEPGGQADKAQIMIWAPGADPNVDAPVLNVPLSFLDNGNLQAHYDQPHGNKP